MLIRLNQRLPRLQITAGLPLSPKSDVLMSFVMDKIIAVAKQRTLHYIIEPTLA